MSGPQQLNECVGRDEHAPPSCARRRPRVLYVARYLPYVPSSGALTRSFRLVEAAAAAYDVVLIGKAQEQRDGRLSAVRSLCCEVRELRSQPGVLPRAISVPMRYVQALSSRRSPFRPAGAVLNRLRMFEGMRRMSQRTDRSGVRAILTSTLKQGRCDLVIVEHTEIARKLSDLLEAWGGPRIADLHNVMHVHEERMRIARGELPADEGRVTTATPLTRVEEHIVASYTVVTATSNVDADHLRRLGRGRVEVIPNGVDVGYFGAPAESVAAPDSLKREEGRLVFTGLLSYEPNIDALGFFVREIWPLIRARRPATRFDIIGGGPVSEAVREVGASPGVDLHVDVPDVRPYLAHSHVAVVPIRLGSGTRLKILEALASRIPVVSTTIGAEGLNLAMGRDLLLADTPTEFADSVLDLLDHPHKARELAIHGHQTVCGLYDWSRIQADFQALICRVLGSHGPSKWHPIDSSPP